MFEERFSKVYLKKPILFHSFTDQNTKFMESFEMIRYKIGKARRLEGESVYIKLEKT